MRIGGYRRCRYFSLSVALAPKEHEVFLGDQFGVDRGVAAAFSEAVLVDSSFATVQRSWFQNGL